MFILDSDPKNLHPRSGSAILLKRGGAKLILHFSYKQKELITVFFNSNLLQQTIKMCGNRDPRFRIQKKITPDPGGRKAPDHGSRS
jgi:hypothetical protein